MTIIDVIQRLLDARELINRSNQQVYLIRLFTFQSIDAVLYQSHHAITVMHLSHNEPFRRRPKALFYKLLTRQG